jgi:hypothetical protein
MRKLIGAALGLPGDAPGGYTFRTHVAPTGGGRWAKADYAGCSWGTITGTPDENTTVYHHGHVFNLGISFAEAQHTGKIRRLGNALGISADIVFSPPGFGVAGASSSVVNTPTGSTASIPIQTPWAPGAGVISANGWYSGDMCQIYGDQGGDFGPCVRGIDIPQTCDTITVEFLASVSSGASGSTDRSAFYVGYQPHTNNWNDDLPTLRYEFYTSQRTNPSVSDYDFEWHNNSSYTSLHTSGNAALVSSAPWATNTLYLRYRFTGTGSWINHGAVSFYDQWRSMC